MSLEKAKEHLKKYNLEKRVLEFTTSSATVKEAAVALSCREEEIAKTLSFLIDTKPILIVVAGDKKIDNSKYKKEFGIKAKMISADEVEKIVGHGVGGVCPFGVNNGVTIYLDVSLKEHSYIYPACGSNNSAIKLTLEELEEASCYDRWVDICK